ncbi:MAG: hypothetical protein COB66_03980 [Coxiella sp. (in: Bacteria)]|nr:MAG: hypothetical protein COB66_03980 [Coxiella sp. (in: g-proteobacteria)]
MKLSVLSIIVMSLTSVAATAGNTVLTRFAGGNFQAPVPSGVLGTCSSPPGASQSYTNPMYICRYGKTLAVTAASNNTMPRIYAPTLKGITRCIPQSLSQICYNPGVVNPPLNPEPYFFINETTNCSDVIAIAKKACKGTWAATVSKPSCG